jgi:hypothetical protein
MVQSGALTQQHHSNCQQYLNTLVGRLRLTKAATLRLCLRLRLCPAETSKTTRPRLRCTASVKNSCNTSQLLVNSRGLQVWVCSFAALRVYGSRPSPSSTQQACMHSIESTRWCPCTLTAHCCASACQTCRHPHLGIAPATEISLRKTETVLVPAPVHWTQARTATSSCCDLLLLLCPHRPL